MRDIFHITKPPYQFCNNVETIRFDFKKNSFLIKRGNFSPETLKYWVGVQQGQSYFMGKRCLFSLGWPLLSDGVAIKMAYGVDVLYRPASHPNFSCWVG